MHVSNGRTGSYVALSYCWGGDVKCKLTNTRLEGYQKRIVYADLPQTFKDAIFITRALKFQYLWIYALCIVQDDPDDWDRQAAAMRRVYADACLTISAMRLEKCKDGFLGDRQISQIALGACETMEGVGRRTFGVRNSQSGHMFEGPLNYRAWAFQERFLSPAILHYSSHRGMIWECKALCVDETGETEATNPVLKALQLTDSESALAYSSALNPKDLWFTTVEDYTHRNLTFPKDKLAAISGVAQTFKKLHGLNYCAGLWKDDLARDLLWSRNGHAELSRAIPYRAPTWSWAAYDGQISWDRELHDYAQPLPASLPFCVVAAHVEEVLPGSCGAVLQTHLEVQGLLYNGSFPGHMTDRSIGNLYTGFGYSSECRMGTDFSAKSCWVMPTGMWPSYVSDGAEVWALVLGKPDEFTAGHRLRNCFVRIGMAIFPTQGGSAPSQPDFNQVKMESIRLI